MQLTRQHHCSGTLSWGRGRHSPKVLECERDFNLWYLYRRGGKMPRNASYLRWRNWKRRWKKVKRNTGTKSVFAWASQQRGARKLPKIYALRCLCTRFGLYNRGISSVQVFNRFIPAAWFPLFPLARWHFVDFALGYFCHTHHRFRYKYPRRITPSPDLYLPMALKKVKAGVKHERDDTNDDLQLQSPKKLPRQWTEEDAKLMKKLKEEDKLTWVLYLPKLRLTEDKLPQNFLVVTQTKPEKSIQHVWKRCVNLSQMKRLILSLTNLLI